MQINQLSSIDTVQDGDLVPVFSSRNGDARKIAVSKLLAPERADIAKKVNAADLGASSGAQMVGYADASGGLSAKDVGSALSEVSVRLGSAKAIAKTLELMRSGAATKIICYGDSITWGYQPGTGAQVATPYPVALQTRLRTCFSNANITVLNRGTTGWQSDEGLANLQVKVLNDAPNLVIVMFGINDVRGSGTGGAALTQDAYRANMASIVTSIRASGAEVIVMSSNPILDTTNSYNKKLLTYVKAAEEVALERNAAFINLHKEISQRFRSKSEVPTLLLPDNLHFIDAKYSLIADIVLGRMLDYHNFADGLVVKNSDEIHVPLAYSAFADTDCTNFFTNSGQFFQTNLLMRSDGSSGSYFRFSFYMETAGMALVLKSPKNTIGGQAAVRDNGAVIKTVDFYSPETHIFEAEDVLIENVAPGYHVIEFLLADMSKGKSIDATKGNVYLERLTLRPTRAPKANKLYMLTAGATLGTAEIFKRVTPGTARFSLAADSDTGILLLEQDCADLRSGKTLVIEAEGKFMSGSGLSWLGNIAQGATVADNNSGCNSGYLLYFQGTGLNAARIHSMGQNNNYGAPIIQATVTMDYTVSHKIRITHTAAGLITVYLDGAQILQVTNTDNQSGWFGIYAHFAGTVDLSRYEYAYI